MSEAYAKKLSQLIKCGKVRKSAEKTNMERRGRAQIGNVVGAKGAKEIASAVLKSAVQTSEIAHSNYDSKTFF